MLYRVLHLLAKLPRSSLHSVLVNNSLPPIIIWCWYWGLQYYRCTHNHRFNSCILSQRDLLTNFSFQKECIRSLLEKYPTFGFWLTWSVGHLITLKVVPLRLHTLIPRVPPLFEACWKSLLGLGCRCCHNVIFCLKLGSIQLPLEFGEEAEVAGGQENKEPVEP